MPNQSRRRVMRVCRLADGFAGHRGVGAQAVAIERLPRRRRQQGEEAPEAGPRRSPQGPAVPVGVGVWTPRRPSRRIAHTRPSPPVAASPQGAGYSTRGAFQGLEGRVPDTSGSQGPVPPRRVDRRSWFGEMGRASARRNSTTTVPPAPPDPRPVHRPPLSHPFDDGVEETGAAFHEPYTDG